MLQTWAAGLDLFRMWKSVSALFISNFSGGYQETIIQTFPSQHVLIKNDGGLSFFLNACGSILLHCLKMTYYFLNKGAYTGWHLKAEIFKILYDQ